MGDYQQMPPPQGRNDMLWCVFNWEDSPVSAAQGTPTQTTRQHNLPQQKDRNLCQVQTSPQIHTEALPQSLCKPKQGAKLAPNLIVFLKNEYFPESIFRKNTTTEILIVAEESKDETTCTTINPILRNTKMIEANNLT